MPSYFVRDVASSSSFYPPVTHQTNKFNGLIDNQIWYNNGGGGGGGGGGDARNVSNLQLRKEHNSLNVNGKKFYRNKEKTIWSYNPDDFLIRVSLSFR